MLIPLKVDVPMGRLPWANYVLIAAIVGISIAGFLDTPTFMKFAGIEQSSSDIQVTLDPDGNPVVLAAQPHLPTKQLPLPVLALTSSFLHGGFVHLLGNMLFLWIFGNAINYKFGQAGYAGLYLVCAMAAGISHYLFQGGPVIGASGAINGVMAAFLVFFPRNDITVMWIIFLRPRFSTVSSFWIILMWVAWDVFFLAIGVSSGVALWAHVGGFVTGLTIALLCLWTGLVKPTQDEQTILQVLGINR